MDRFKELGIDTHGHTSGKMKTKCPWCHAQRTDKRDKSLSVNLDTKLYLCHYCGAHGSAAIYAGKGRKLGDPLVKFPTATGSNSSCPPTEKPHGDPEQGALTQKQIEWCRDVRHIPPEVLVEAGVAFASISMPISGKEKGWEKRDCLCFNFFENGELVNTKFRDSQKEAMNLARIGNKYLADTEPWKLAKTDMERVATILHISLQLVANLAIAFEPFLPFSSEKLRKMLNMDSFDWAELGHTDLLPAGHQLGTPELLFEKIEDDVIQAQVDKLLATKKANEAATYKANPIKPTIAFEDFEKLDIRVGTVLECEAVPKMKKLLKFKIADGLENRTIVSGIAQHYKPEELVGKQVLFIANLAPRQFKNGLVSEGMILSAENYDGSLAVTSLLKEVKPGSEVK